MNFEKDLQRILKEEGRKSIEKHASVSSQHGCKCNQCFCCYCLQWLKENKL